MNTFRLTLCAVAAVISSSAFSGEINRCVNAQGQTVLSDRPCGGPSASGDRLQGQQGSRPIVVENLPAKDIFNARDRIAKEGMPMAPETINSADMQPGYRLPKP
ncbi:MAG: DUF4124 domain-containing protein [Variovorax sp.]|nr:MAG: DUF4124 domain-containing protein [Variovorax sp.]